MIEYRPNPGSSVLTQKPSLFCVVFDSCTQVALCLMIDSQLRFEDDTFAVQTEQENKQKPVNTRGATIQQAHGSVCIAVYGSRIQFWFGLFSTLGGRKKHDHFSVFLVHP